MSRAFARICARRITIRAIFWYPLGMDSCVRVSMCRLQQRRRSGAVSWRNENHCRLTYLRGRGPPHENARTGSCHRRRAWPVVRSSIIWPNWVGPTVVLLERDELTSGSTWHAAANIHGLHDNNNITRIQHYTMNLYKELEKETGQSCGVFQPGSLVSGADRGT